MTRFYLVTYDICDALRLRRVHAIVRDFGQPVQYSVFLANLNELQKAELKRLLGHAINHDEDQVLLFDLGRVHGQHEIEFPDHDIVGRPFNASRSRVVVV